MRATIGSVAALVPSCRTLRRESVSMRALVSLISFSLESFRLDARGLHHLGPFLRFGDEMRAELRRREQHRRRADFRQLGRDAGITETGIELAIEPLDDLARRAGRS